VIEISNVKKNINLKYIERSSSYRTVNSLVYKNQGKLWLFFSRDASALMHSVSIVLFNVLREQAVKENIWT